MTLSRYIVGFLAASTLALSSAALASADDADGFHDNWHRELGSTPSEGAPGPAQNDDYPAADPSDQYREGIEDFGDPTDRTGED